MQINQIKQQFAQVEQSIKRATQALQSDNAAPPELKESVRQLGTQSTKAAQVFEQSPNEENVRLTIEELEETGDRAKKAAEQAGGVNPQTKNAVLQAHELISQLKKQLH